jgi:hypothetical protein
VDNNVVSEETTLTIKGLREAYSKIDKDVDYYQNHDPFCDLSARLNMNSTMCCHAIRKFYKQ